MDKYYRRYIQTFKMNILYTKTSYAIKTQEVLKLIFNQFSKYFEFSLFPYLLLHNCHH